MEEYKRRSVFSELKDFDPFTEAYDYIELTEWHNGEGFDIEINCKNKERFSLTWGQYKALKKIVKKLLE